MRAAGAAAEFIVPCYRLFEANSCASVGIKCARRPAGHGARTAIGAETDCPGTRRPRPMACWAELGVFGTRSLTDGRLAVALMRTAVRIGAIAINYVEAERLVLTGGRVSAIIAPDCERQSASSCARKRCLTRPGRMGRRSCAADAGSCGAADRDQPWLAHRVAGFVPARCDRPDDSQDRRWPCDVRHSVARQPDDRHDRRRGQWPDMASEASDAEIEFIADTARRYLQSAPTRRRL